MPTHDNLGLRMKTFYEQIPKTKLMRRTPVCIRIDGKAFHTFTKNFKRPFDEILIESMQETAKYLCENIQGCVMSYQQSDEISLVLIDYQKLTSDAWFDYEVQKMCSVAASMATMAFNKIFDNNVRNLIWDYNHSFVPQCMNLQKEIAKYHNTLLDATGKGAMFDARCFNLPKEEVANYIYWRQLDATRNSIQMVGQANFSHKELHGKTCNMIQDMLHEQKGINWNDLDTHLKRGSCCIKTERKETEKHIYEEQPFGKPRETIKKIIEHPKWIIDKEIPIFKGEDRKYIEDLIYVGE